MLDHHDESDGPNEGNSAPVPLGMLERGKSNPRGINDRLEVDEPAGQRDKVAKDDGEKHGNSTDETTHAREDDSRKQGDCGNDGSKPVEHGSPIRRRRLKGHLGSSRREANADDHHDGGDKYRREQPVEPSGAHELNDSRNSEEHQACHNNAREGGIEATRGANDHNGADEGKRATQVAGNLVPSYQEVADGSDARAHDGHVWIKAREDRNQNRRAKHAHHVLDAQRDGARDRDPVIDADYLSFVSLHAIDHTPFLRALKVRRINIQTLHDLLVNFRQVEKRGLEGMPPSPQ